MAQSSGWAHTSFDAYQSRAWRFVSIVLAGVVLAGMVAAKVGGAGTPVAAPAPTRLNTPVSQPILADLKTASSSILDFTGGPAPLSEAARVGTSTAPVKNPLVLYVGGEFCPYCAAERWATVLTLMRFGQLSGLKYMASSSTDVFPSTPTFTFHGSKYQSPYIQFQGVEWYGRTTDASGNHPILQQPTPAQLHAVETLDAPPVMTSQAGSIPFIDIAGRYVWAGAPYLPTYLKQAGWTGVAQELVTLGKTGQGNSNIQAIAHAANLFTAAICSTDGGKPAAVCSAPGIKAAMGGLPK